MIALPVWVCTGQKVYLTLRPAAPTHGNRVPSRRPRFAGRHPAKAENVGDTRLSTTLVKDDVRISTVEHLLSAFAGLGIDNAYVGCGARRGADHGRQRRSVRVSDPVGRCRGTERRQAFHPHQEPVEVRDGDKIARFEPFNGFRSVSGSISTIRR